MVKDILGGMAAAVVAGFCLGTGYKGASKFWGKVGEWTDPRMRELKNRLEEASRLAEEERERAAKKRAQTLAELEGASAPREEAL